jgi:putative redox protein
MVEIEMSYEGDLHCAATHRPSESRLATDAPVDNQGRGAAFSPTDLLATSLGTCMLTTMAIVARREGIELRGSAARVEKHMSSAPPRRVARLVVTARLRAEPRPSAEQRARLERAGDECPVRLSLGGAVEVPTEYLWQA